jgi:uncharacterized protein (TIGR03000 family)
MKRCGNKRIVAFVALALMPPSFVSAQQGAAKPALVRVMVPAEAQLHFDQHLTRQSGTDRLFETPPLPAGKSYSYLLKATWPQGNRQVVRMAVATVQAGGETVIDLRPGSKDATSSEIVYVPTPQRVVDKMLEMAKLTKDDVVFDLGCGDGRVVVTAAEKYGARGVGIDIDPARIKQALANVEKAGVAKLVEIRQGDALKVPDLARATVVMTYMLPEFMEKLKLILKNTLKPGTRVVAHDYAVPGWEPLERATVPGGTRIHAHTLYLWRIEKK